MNKLMGVLAFLATVGSAQATIIDQGDYLTDTTMGLDWLDVTKSAGLTFSYVSSELGDGGRFSGWRYATGNELLTLVSNFSSMPIPTSNGIVVPEGYLDNLISILGDTLDSYYLLTYGMSYGKYWNVTDSTQASYRYSKGMLADVDANRSVYIGALVDADYQSRDSDYVTSRFNSPVTIDSMDNSVGSFLVRAVPEPTSLALLGAGLFGISLHRKKQNR